MYAGRQICCDFIIVPGTQFEQSRFSGFKIFGKMLQPTGMGEVTGGKYPDTLDGGPGRKAWQTAGLARCP